MISNLTEWVQSALVMLMGWLRSRTHDLWIGLKPSRAGLLTVVILFALLFEPWSQQGRDVLLEYGLADPADDPWAHI